MASDRRNAGPSRSARRRLHPAAAAQRAPRELTLRAVLVGCGIGALLAAGNVYTGIKTGFIDGGSISAAVLGFTFFAVFAAAAARPTRVAENNITQTTAAVGRGHVVRARRRRTAVGAGAHGQDLSGLAARAVAVGLGLLGILLAAMLRNKLIVVEELALPHRRRHGRGHRDDPRRARSRRCTARACSRWPAWRRCTSTWFRDGPWALIPQV